LPAFEVRGDHRQQRIAKIWRTSAHRKLSVMGERFHFTAENRGAFGGSFKKRRIGGTARELLPRNVLDLVPVGPKLFMFTGLAHLGVSHGAVYVVDDYDTAPKRTR
jgi:hypothetical protein